VGGATNASDSNLEINDTLLAGLQTGFTQVFIGRSDSSGLISLGNNIVFNNPVTLRSPSTFSAFAGAINTSAFSFTNAGTVTFLANQNITTGNITAAGNAIALTSTNGAINTSAGRISTATSSGNAGSITFQASGDITTGAGTTPNPAIASFITGGTGNPSSITFTSTNGAINTSLGDIDAGGGNITFVARNNITTSGVFSRAANGGTISLASQAGAINTSAGDVTTTTTDSRGTGGNITLTANGNVTTKGVFATGDDGKIEITSSTGGIDTTTGASSLASIGANNSITLTAQQNILTRDIFASGQNTSLSITSNAGLINTSLGTLNTSGTTGDAGNISLNAGTSSIFGNLNASSTVGNAGAIAFNISGNTTLTGSEINVRSASGTASNIDFNSSSVILNTPSLVIDTSGGTNSGNITFSGNLNGTTANVNNLSINAGAGNINFEQIGNTVPLGFITISTSGTTIFNTVRSGSLQTLNGGSVKLLGNITTNGNIAFDGGAVSIASNIVLNSSAGNGPIFFNSAIANNVTGTPSNLTLNSGTGDIAINKGAGSSGDRFGNITVTNAGNFSTGSGVSIFANSFRQLAGTGRTNFAGNADTFTGDLTVITDNFSVDEGATLIARNVSVNALNGFRANPASRLEVTGTNSEGFSPGTININADSNSDGVGIFSNRGTITDGGLGGSVSVRAASLDIRGSIIGKNLSLIPSTNAPTIAIGSAATGTFRLEDTAISFLNATDLVSIAANNGNVNIGSTQAFNTGTSLEIGTTASPANNITSATGSNLSINKNLSATGTAIALGNVTVGGDLTIKGSNIVFGNTTANNLTIQLSNQVSQTGLIAVAGQTNFIVDTNPLTNLLLADFANSFGSAISLSFINLTTTSFNDLEFRIVNVGAQFNVAPQQVNNLKLILDNGTIGLPSIPLTGSLTLSAKDVSIVGNITATSASLGGGNITINNNLTTTAGDLTIANSGAFRLNPNANLDLKGSLLLSGAGTTAIGGNITRSSSIDFAQPVSLIGNTNIISSGNITFDNSVSGAFSAGSTGNFSNITSNGNITFNGSVDGKFALNLDTNGNFAIINAVIGGTTPLDSLAIASNTTLSSRSTLATTAITFNPIQISTTGNIALGEISNLGENVILNSSAGSITTSAITTANTSGQGGNITLTANGNVTASNINTASSITGSESRSSGGNVNLTSRTGEISTGNITTTGQIGGRIFIDASQAINAGILNSSGSTRAGDVTLDPVGNVVVRAIDASSRTQGGNVTLISTGGNLRITDTLLSSTTSSCVGASICTSGGTGGNITLQTGGLNPFLVDDATLNGSKGVLTTGITTVSLGTSIPVVIDSSFVQGGIKVTPGGIITPTPTDSKQPFINPEPSDKAPTVVANDGNQSPIPVPPDILKREAANYLQQGNLPKAFDALERSYASELQIFAGRTLNLSSTTIEESQDILGKVAQQTGDVAALIYPVLLDNRIEIMVVPPKDKGKPFRQFTVVPSQEAVEGVLTDYRNNIRDVGSNDYLEQSQKLYDWIMRPIDSQLKAMKINTLVFVMDAGLRVVPPAAMHDGKQFVVERYGIASVASMRVTRIEERDRQSTRILAMGLTDSVSGFSALPSVDVEIKTIASNVLEGTSFLNKDFTVNNLQSQRQLGKYSILHLGTHGKFVSDNSQESFIQFWDSRLSLSQIPKLRFDKPVIDMLTLSACQTAVGNNLGISGLAVESGAKSVLASLWEVSDAGTAPLMISFYKSFPNAINKAQAMQQAQVSLLSGKVNIKDGEITGILGLPNIKLPTGGNEIDLSHPFYWSSFILVGNWL